MRSATGLLCLALAACGHFNQAHGGEDIGDADGSSGDSSSSGQPYDVDFEHAADESSSGDNGSSGTAIADIQGVHDGTYVGTVMIEFNPGGTCTGIVEVIVDVGAEQHIVGEGSCDGMIFGVADGGLTEIDGVLALGIPSGDARQTVNGQPFDVTWDGDFVSDEFHGSFAGTLEWMGAPVDFVGSWMTER